MQGPLGAARDQGGSQAGSKSNGDNKRPRSSSVEAAQTFRKKQRPDEPGAEASRMAIAAVFKHFSTLCGPVDAVSDPVDGAAKLQAFQALLGLAVSPAGADQRRLVHKQALCSNYKLLHSDAAMQ